MLKFFVMRLAAFSVFAAIVGLAAPLSAADARPRIISLYPAHTEVLLRLGARDNIVGVSRFETYNGPGSEGFKPVVFTLKDDVEKYLAIKPDIILVRPMHLAAHANVLQALERAGVQIYSDQVVQAKELYDYWRNLAKLVGKEEEAEKMVADFEAAIQPYHAAAQKRAAAPGVFVEAMNQRVKTFTADSVPMWLVSLAGGRNIAADAKPSMPGMIIADYGPERLLARHWQVEIFISQKGPMNMGDVREIRRRRIYQPLAAFKSGAVYQIPEAVFARPTPSLLEGLKLLAEWTGLQAEMDAPEDEADEAFDSDPVSGENKPAEENAKSEINTQ